MEATMIKKIILLVLSFSFSVTSVVYGTATKADPVSSGTGKGTSVKIADASALSKIMSQIPSYEDYAGEKSISELYPDFKPFTMIETGYGSNVVETATTRKIVKDGQSENLPLIQHTEDTTNHSLSISFTKDAVYYHSVGSKTVTDTYYEITTENLEYGENEFRRFYDAECTVINFDAEIYHSKDATMIKYNKYETIETVANDVDRYGNPIFKAAEEEVLTDEDEIMEKQMQDKVAQIREDNYGVWLKLETYTEEEMATKFGSLWNPDSPITEENYAQYKDLMIDYMVYETCNLASEAEARSFLEANENNCIYFGNLASFITGEDENVGFEKKGNQYSLIYSKRVQTGVDEETQEPKYEYKDVGKQAYISKIFGDPYNNTDNYYTNVSFSYVVGSDVAVVLQKAGWQERKTSTPTSLDRRFEMDTTTHFLALDNTVVAIEKNATVKTMAEAYSSGLREIYSTYMDQMMSKGDN